MGLLILGAIIFVGIHFIKTLTPDLRNALAAKTGEGAWKGIFSITALAGLVAMIIGYGQARQVPEILYILPFETIYVTVLLVLISLILFIAGNLPAGRIKKWAKHPMLAGVKIWAFAHLLVNGDLASVILFGSLLLWAIVSILVLKRRAANSDEPDLMGEVRTWPDIAAIIGGIALWFAIVGWLHTALIGIPAIG